MKKNKAVHKGNGLLPYPVIVSASQGDILAMNVVLSHYEPYMATAIEQTWKAAQTQIKNVVNNVVFPVVDMILAILFFVKLGTAYFDYRRHGQFEFAAPAILFACLLFTLTAPLYIWTIL